MVNKVPSFLNQGADRYSDSPALIAHQRVISYGQLRELTGAALTALKNSGIRPGQRIAIWSQNSLEYIILLLAALHYGVTACPVSTRIPGMRVGELLQSIECGILVTGKGAPDLVETKRFNVVPLASLGGLTKAAIKADSAAVSLPTLDLNQDATTVFTSGSSDRPKAALHSFANHYYSALGSNRNIPLKQGDRWLLSLPLYHVGGLAILFRCFLSGAAVVVPGQGQLGQLILRHKISHISLVPTQLQRLLKEERVDELAVLLKAVLIGGGAISGALLEAASKRGFKLHTSYGLTEMSSQVTTTAAGDGLGRLASSGKLLKYRELKIAGDGEILVGGSTLFKGYLNQETPFDREGWFATGDLGRWDEDGYLTVLGRKDNMFISGGENIHCEEIEAQLCRLLRIEQVVVVPVADQEYGHRPVAFVKYVRGKNSVDKVKAEVGGHLARFKIPVKFYNWPEDYKSSGLKVNRGYFKKLAASLENG